MPKDVIQSNWYYGSGIQHFIKGNHDVTLAAIGEMDALGYDQIPAAATGILSTTWNSLLCSARTGSHRSAIWASWQRLGLTHCGMSATVCWTAAKNWAVQRSWFGENKQSIRKGLAVCKAYLAVN